MEIAENLASKHGFDCINLDMFVSKTFGVHWSFGVVFMRNPRNCIDKIKSNTNWRMSNLVEKYNTCYIDEFNFNVDWLFTFLRDTQQLKLGTFSINNATVVHMPDISISRHWAFTITWKDKSIEFPLIKYLYKDYMWSSLPINENVIKIDVEINPSEASDFLNTFYKTDYWFEYKILDFALRRGLINSDTYKKFRLEDKIK